MKVKITKYKKTNNEKALKEYLSKTSKDERKQSSRRNRACTNSKQYIICIMFNRPRASVENSITSNIYSVYC